MPRVRQPWPPDLFARAVAENSTIKGILDQLGAVVSGSNYQYVHRQVAQQGLATGHWLGPGHLRGKHHSWKRTTPLAEILVANCDYNRGRLKNRLIADGLLADACAVCATSEWRGRKLVLHLDHINGVGDDNRLENLRLLCPNCHSQTATYCGKNMRFRRDTSGGRSAGSGI